MNIVKASFLYWSMLRGWTQLLSKGPVFKLRALDNSATFSIVWQGDYCILQLTREHHRIAYSNLQVRRSAVLESVLQPLQTAGLALCWGLVPLCTFICISQMCQGRGRLKNFKNASQMLLWVLQKSQRITGTVEVPGGDAAMRMLRHSCSLEILKWSGRGDCPFFKSCQFCSLCVSFCLQFFLASPFPKWWGYNITGCTHGNCSFPGRGCKVFVFWVGFHGLRPNQPFGSSSHLYRFLICHGEEI